MAAHSIENGVKDLLFAIAIDHDLVTFTSYEGHRYADETKATDERHVGVIPRSPEERRRILALFEETALEVNRTHPSGPVEVAIMDHTVIDGEMTYPAVDIYLTRREGHDWSEYFSALDRVCGDLTGRLLERARSDLPPSPQM